MLSSFSNFFLGLDDMNVIKETDNSNSIKVHFHREVAMNFRFLGVTSRNICPSLIDGHGNLFIFSDSGL